MTKTQVFKAGKSIVIGMFCLLLPTILNASKDISNTVSFEGTVLRTEFKEAPKNDGLVPKVKDALLDVKSDYFWIYVDTRNGETAFLVQTYPDITARLNTLKQGDPVAIEAKADELGRGHYFPQLIRRNDDVIFQAAQMETYEGKKVRFLYYAGAAVLALGLAELAYYYFKDRPRNAVKDFTKSVQ